MWREVVEAVAGITLLTAVFWFLWVLGSCF